MLCSQDLLTRSGWAVMKALLEGEVDIRDQFGIISRERGVTFQTCVSQGHSAHGRVERRIKMIQECLDRSGLKATKLHSLGWQTIAKTLEHDVNSIPLGFLQHQTSNGPLLRVLTPNSLKLNSSSNRAPSGLLNLPNSAADLMDDVERKYNLFYKIWNEDYILLIADRSGTLRQTILKKIICSTSKSLTVNLALSGRSARRSISSWAKTTW